LGADTQHDPEGVALKTFDLDRSIPSEPHKLCEPSRIVAIGFVELE
jgi:hypothetical protein